MGKFYKRMDADEFTAYLMTLKVGQQVDFAVCIEENDYVEVLNDNDPLYNWYFAKRMKISEYGSNFILIDYAGGEEAMAIPLNGYSDTLDEDDREIIRRRIKRFFCDNDRMATIQYVYVEMETEGD